MPIYKVTIYPEPLIDMEYRIEADSLEKAEQAATSQFYDSATDFLAFTVNGEEAQDQDTPADFAAGD